MRVRHTGSHLCISHLDHSFDSERHDLGSVGTLSRYAISDIQVHHNPKFPNDLTRFLTYNCITTLTALTWSPPILGDFCCHTDTVENGGCGWLRDGHRCIDDEEGTCHIYCWAVSSGAVFSLGFMIFMGVWINTRASWYQPYMGGYSVHAKSAADNPAGYWALDVFLVLGMLLLGTICTLFSCWAYCCHRCFCGCAKGEVDCDCDEWCRLYDCICDNEPEACSRMWYSASILATLCPSTLLFCVAYSMVQMEENGTRSHPMTCSCVEFSRESSESDLASQ